MTTAARCGAASGRRHGCHQGVYTVGGETVDTVCRAEGHGFKFKPAVGFISNPTNPIYVDYFRHTFVLYVMCESVQIW